MQNSNDCLIEAIDNELQRLRELKTKDRFDNMIIKENGNTFKLEFQDTAKFAFRVKVTYRLKNDYYKRFKEIS